MTVKEKMKGKPAPEPTQVSLCRVSALPPSGWFEQELARRLKNLTAGAVRQVPGRAPQRTGG